MGKKKVAGGISLISRKGAMKRWPEYRAGELEEGGERSLQVGVGGRAGKCLGRHALGVGKGAC